MSASSASAEFGKDDEGFMAACLCSFDNQLGKIDLNILAERLGKNAKSAESKFYALKKKYGFTIKVTFNKAQHGEVPTKVVKPKRTPRKATKKANVNPKTPPEALEEAQESEDDAIPSQANFLDSFAPTVPVSSATLETLSDEV